MEKEHDTRIAATALRKRLDADRLEIEHLTIRMDDETRRPYFDDILSCVAEYEALLAVETAARLVRGLRGDEFGYATARSKLIDTLDRLDGVR